MPSREFIERVAQLNPQRLRLLVLQLQGELERPRSAPMEPIAVVGSACRFPGNASTPQQFWRAIEQGVDAVTEAPPERWDEAMSLEGLNPREAQAARYGGFVNNVDLFDAEHFGISPREANRLDPQHRLLLEVAWEALEDAGKPPDGLDGSPTGVFVGMTTNDYSHLHSRTPTPTEVDLYDSTGNTFSAAVGRLSYLLGLHGPCLALDTACSSSLVAIHLACQSLCANESHMALAGGVHLLLSPLSTVAIAKLGILSPVGRCKAFSGDADGFVRSDGCALVVLKRLRDAEADGDRVLGVIRGSAVNQDGRSGGLTAPNGLAQNEVILAALTRAGLQPSDISYLEAHGTGTNLGDPIEMQAIGEVFGPGRSPSDALLVGSVKTNIGHTGSAAGIAGLIKVLQMFEHREIPPHLHLTKPSPHIPWSELPVTIPTKPQPWTAANGRRIAGVSSFGFGGTNAHLVVEEPPCREPSPATRERGQHLMCLTASSREALREVCSSMQQRLREIPDERLADVCFSVNTGRAQLAQRLCVIGKDRTALIRRLSSCGNGAPEADTCWQATVDQLKQPGIGWILPRDDLRLRRVVAMLRQTQPLWSELHQDLIERVEARPPFDSGMQDDPARLERASARRASFTHLYLVARLWQIWGLEPIAIHGKGLGLWVAACVSGCLRAEDAWHLLGVDTLTATHESWSNVTLREPDTMIFIDIAGTATRLQGGRDFREALSETLRYTHCEATAVKQLPRDSGAPPPDCAVILELGTDAKDAVGAADVSRLSLCDEAHDPEQALLALAGQLFVRGVRIDWRAFDRGYDRRRVSLPPYPFQRRRFWIDGSRAPASDGVDRRAEWSAAKQAATAFAAESVGGLKLERYPAQERALSQMALEAMARTFDTLGAVEAANVSFSLDDLMTRTGILPVYRSLIKRWLVYLVEAGVLTQQSVDTFICRSLPLTVGDAPSRDTGARAELMSEEPLLTDLFQRCSKNLPEMLLGDVSALSVLFPAGSREVADYLYRDWVVPRFFNGIIQAAIEAVSERRGERTLRVLEIGAGTGATTAALLPALPKTVDYCFTDISEFFLSAARPMFREHPNVRYRLLNIEADMEDQGFSRDIFDVVVASNVLHATHDIRRTVRNVGALLAPGGTLALLEMTRHAPWLDMTVGLIDGLNAHDDDLRGDRSLLALESWKQLLEADTFTEITPIPAPDDAANVFGQHVILARTREAVVSAACAAETRGAVNSGTHEPTMRAGTNGLDALQAMQELRSSPVDARPVLLRQTLRRAVALALSRPEHELRGGVPLQELGFDSLLDLAFRHQLESSLGVAIEEPLSPMDFEQLAQAVSGRLSDLFPSADPVAQPEGHGIAVTRLKGGTRGQPPIVCVHPGGLDASCYAALAEALPRTQPFLVLQLPTLDVGSRTPGGRHIVQVLAAGCLERLAEERVPLPYLMAGWSFGGLIAYEMSLQLAERGESVPLSILFDAGNGPTESRDSRLEWFTRFLGARAGRDLDIPRNQLSQWSDPLALVFREARDQGVVPEATSINDLRTLFEIYNRGVDLATDAASTYSFGHSRVENICLMEAEQLREGISEIRERALHHFSTTTYRAFTVPGDHYSMFRADLIGKMADHIAKLLAELRFEAGRPDVSPQMDATNG